MEDSNERAAMLGDLREAIQSASFEVVTAATFMSRSRRRLHFEERGQTKEKFVVVVTTTSGASSEASQPGLPVDEVSVAKRRASDARCLSVKWGGTQQQQWQFRSGCERETFCAWLRILGQPSGVACEGDSESVVPSLAPGSFAVHAEMCNFVGQFAETTVVVDAAEGELRIAAGRAVSIRDVQLLPSASHGRRVDVVFTDDRPRSGSVSERPSSLVAGCGPCSAVAGMAESSSKRVALYLASSYARETLLARCRQLATTLEEASAPSSAALVVCCATLNAGDGKPPDPASGLDAWLPVGSADVYAVGFQENSEKRKWLKALDEHLCCGHKHGRRYRTVSTSSDDAASSSRTSAAEAAASRQLGEARLAERGVVFEAGAELYTLAVSSTLWDIHVLVYVRRDLKAGLLSTAAATEATGFAHVLGNKGAAAVGLNLTLDGAQGLRNGDLRLAFISSHLAARASRVAHRQSNYEEIAAGLRLGAAADPSARGLEVLHQFDCVFWLGDLNFRVDCGKHGDPQEFAACLDKVHAEAHTDLLTNDQLLLERNGHAAVMAVFDEPDGGPSFPPTYRMVKKQPRVYSNKKCQNPSFCDRVLYKTHNTTWLDDDHHAGGHRTKLPRPRGGAVAPLSYRAVFDAPMAMSDHRPVMALFAVEPKPPPSPPSAVAALDAAWLCLEDVVFTLAPEVSAPGCETAYKYDGYSGALNLAVRAPFLFEKNDKAAFGASQFQDLSVSARCVAPARCDAAKAQAHRRLKKPGKHGKDDVEGERASSVAISSSCTDDGPPDRPDVQAAARTVWSAETPTWAWPHHSTAPLFSRVVDDARLAREKLVVCVRKTDASNDILGVAEIGLELPLARRWSSLSSHKAPDASAADDTPGDVDASPKKQAASLRPWHAAHARHDAAVWRDIEPGTYSPTIDESAVAMPGQPTTPTRSRVTDALIDEDGEIAGGPGGAVFSAPVVRHGKWIGVLCGRVRIGLLPDLAAIPDDGLLPHLAAWQQLAHVDALVAETAKRWQQSRLDKTRGSAILDASPAAAAVVVVKAADDRATRSSLVDGGESIPADHRVARASLVLEPANATVATPVGRTEQETDTPGTMRHEEDADKADAPPTPVTRNCDDDGAAVVDDGLPVAGDGPINVLPEAYMSTSDPSAVKPPTVVRQLAVVDAKTETGRLAAPEPRAEDRPPPPPRLHSLNAKREAKLRRDCLAFDRLYRGGSGPTSDDEEDEDEEPRLDARRRADDEVVYLEANATVVLERRGTRIPVEEFRCVDTGASLQDVDFALSPEDGSPRTREAHLVRFGPWLDGTTLRPLSPETDDWLSACGHKWMRAFFRCAATGVKLDPSNFYEHESRPYCEEAYRELFFTCHACREPTRFDGADGIRALGESWHKECYRCANEGCPHGGVLADGMAWGHDAGDGKGVHPYCEACYRSRWTRRCPSCGDTVLPGVDPHVEACGELWHAAHFRCAATGASLQEQPYYEHDGLPYAVDAYLERFGDRCDECGEVVKGEVVRAAGRAWHPEHFVCRASGRKIPRGADGELEFYIGDDGEVYDRDAYLEHAASHCCTCDEPVLDQRRDIGPPETPPPGGNGGLDVQSLRLVPADAPAAYHPECLVCVVSDVRLDPDAVFVGPDDGLAYSKTAYASKYGRCFLTGRVFAPDEPVVVDGLGLTFSERAYRATHTDDWCIGCAQPLVAADDSFVDHRGLKWHRACGGPTDAPVIDAATLDARRQALAAAKRQFAADFQSKVDAYAIQQRELLARCKARCKARRRAKASAEKEAASLNKAVAVPETTATTKKTLTARPQAVLPPSPPPSSTTTLAPPSSTMTSAPMSAPARRSREVVLPSAPAASGSRVAASPPPTAKPPRTAKPPPIPQPAKVEERPADKSDKVEEAPPVDEQTVQDADEPAQRRGSKAAPEPTLPPASSLEGSTSESSVVQPVAHRTLRPSSAGFVVPTDEGEGEDYAAIERRTEASNPMLRRSTRLSTDAELVTVAAANSARRKSQLAEDTFEGLLEKKGGGTSVFGRKNWLERFFVITADSTLRYYRDKDTYLHGGPPLKDAAFALHKCRVSAAPSTESHSPVPSHLFIEPMSHDAGGRSLELRAATPQEHDRWLEELQRRALED